MKISMIPGIDVMRGETNGIARVVEAYYKYLPALGIQIVSDGSQDLRVVHAGITGAECDVAVLHGIYFTGDYMHNNYELSANRKIVDAVRSARVITVPSKWVAEIIQRDMHLDPVVVPHGIEADEWKHSYPNQGYVLYNKNRDGMDVCNSFHVVKLAEKAKNVKFISTFCREVLPNVTTIGVQPHQDMKGIIQRAGVYLSTTKETFGIGVLEAMASGVPVLGFRYGGNVDLVQHGVNGYLANPMDYDDLYEGLLYCLKYRDTLGYNGMLLSREWRWESAVEKLKVALDRAMVVEPPSVSVIIPTYNYAQKVSNAIDSAFDQEFKPKEIIVIDDGSSDNTKEVIGRYVGLDKSISFRYLYRENGGVAVARNHGASEATGKYLCFLDADDRIDKPFLKRCVDALEKDQSLQIAYTRLLAVSQSGEKKVSTWPDVWNFDKQLKRQNQIPTCCVIRRSAWERMGGQRQRYAPLGAGSEDADMWTRAGSLGMKAALVTEEPLFIYTLNSGNTSKPGYHEVDWLSWHPWTFDGVHPFASFATPKKQSHLVMQYDEPVISVVIPVGPGHETTVVNALDSLEAQTFRKWEAVIAWDSYVEVPEFLMKAYPYIRVFKTNHPGSGPGVGRNLGVANARGSLILFLDSDDWLVPGASLDKMLTEFKLTSGIVYSDYYARSTPSPEMLESHKDRLVSYNQKTGEAIFKYYSQDYDCPRAQQQPSSDIYHWCLVTCLIPKKWHNDIGGFDEKMESWEDVDYHWRMAQAGMCYSRIKDFLVVYEFNTGKRRMKASADNNREIGRGLLQYMSEKYKGVKMAGCPGGCGGKSTYTGPDIDKLMISNSQQNNIQVQNDLELVEIEYRFPNRGEHMVVGPATGIKYGYRSFGDHFLVSTKDIELQEDWFVRADSANRVPQNILEQTVVREPTRIEKTLDLPIPSIVTQNFAPVAPEPVKETLSPIPLDTRKPTVIGLDNKTVVDAVKSDSINVNAESLSDDPIVDLQTIPGVSHEIAKQLEHDGINSKKKIANLGVEGLKAYSGVGDVRAKIILMAVTK